MNMWTGEMFSPKTPSAEIESKCCCTICSKPKAKQHRTFKSSSILFVTVLLFGLPAIRCESRAGYQNATASGTIQVQDSEEKTRPIDAGMEPLYAMTNGFLSLIQPESRGFILEEAGLVDDLTNGDYDVILVSLDDWQMWVQHYLGFVICAAVGVVFIILLPIIGLCFCCCRCCGNCGAKVDEEKKGDQCKRGVCGTLLLIFILIILAGMICGFVTNELLREQSAKDDDHALLNKISLEMNSLENFKINTVNDFKTKVINRVNTTAKDVLNNIQNAAYDAKSSLGNVTDSAEMLEKALKLAQSAEEINVTLIAVKDITSLLIMDQGRLTSNLTSVKTALQNALNNCSSQSCIDLKTKLKMLHPVVDFTQVDNVSQELDNVQDVLKNNLTSLVTDGKQQFDDIATKVQNDINTELTRAEEEVKNISSNAVRQVNSISEDLEKLHLNDSVAKIRSVQDTVDKYGNYRYYGGMVLCCVILLVVLFGLLGLCFGVCGDVAGDDASACNRGVGATILMCGVGLCFIFGWIIMVVVLVLFLGGGLSYTEVCRYAVDIPNAPQPIQDTLNEVTSAQLKNAGFNIKLTDVLRDCQQNKGIYSTLKLDNIINMSEVLNVDNYDIEAKIRDLASHVNVDLSKVVIFSNSTRNELKRLKDADLDNINFTSYKIQLQNPLTAVNLTVLIADIEHTANDLNGVDPAAANVLRSYAETLGFIENTTITMMNIHRAELSRAIQSLETAIAGPPSISETIQDLIETLEKSQKNIQMNGTVLIKEFIEKHGKEIIEMLKVDLKELQNMIENDVGRCEPVHRSLSGVLNAACVTLIDPFNGFWFSIGMCLICFIPFIIISVVLMGLYKKTDEFYDDKSFDDVNYDAYTGMYPGDNIPLEDLRPQKAQRNGGGLPNPGALYGIHNAGYITDDYPVSTPPHDYALRIRESPPQYGNRGYGEDSYPRRGSYPTRDYSVPVSTHYYSPPHYNNKNRTRVY